MRRSTSVPESVVRPEIFRAASDEAPRRGGNRLPPPSPHRRRRRIGSRDLRCAPSQSDAAGTGRRHKPPATFNESSAMLYPLAPEALPRTPIKAGLSPDLQRPVIAEDPKRFQLTM